MSRVAAFTDTYFPAINGVTYTVDLWRSRWNDRYGEMDVVYPRAGGYAARRGEYPVASAPVPLYPGYELALPRVPPELPNPDVAHVHTPFTLGVAGLRYADRRNVPVVASYHTILAERVDQLLSRPVLVSAAREACWRYERRFYESVDLVTTPTADARRYVRATIDPSAEIQVLSNGIDTEFFRPVDSTALRNEYGIGDSEPIVGYTGRHSPEKHLDELIDAGSQMDVTLVLGGDGPSRESLEERARSTNADVSFLGFLDREDLPAFYSMLDVFAFPGRIETQGLVALEANACGTPVVAVDEGALATTVIDGETGYHYPPGDVPALRAAIIRTLADRDRLCDLCLRRREMVSVDHTLDQLASLYERVRADDAV